MKISLKQLRIFILGLTFCLISGGIGFWLGRGKNEVSQFKGSAEKAVVVNKNSAAGLKTIDFSLFWQVWDKLEKKYFDPKKVDRQKMFYGAIQGLAASLGDPYTVFLPPEDNKQAQEDLNGSFGGVGIRLGYKNDRQLAVIAPLKGSPAEAAGVKAGDLILHLKDEQKGIDEDTVGITLPEAVNKIRGPIGTKIYLTLLREGEDKTFVAEIIRDTIVVPSVEIDFVKTKKGQIAHLKLERFGELTAEQWDKAVAEIKTRGGEVKGLVLDVRGNPGGYLKGAVNLASEFLTDGVIVKQENYQQEIETYSVNRRGRLLTIPLVVLIDKGSASASEILAGALQDHGRAKLVGEKSFGKGTIQETEELTGGAGLHITTAKWLTPNGHWVDKKGLTPDWEVKNDPDKPDEDKQLDKAIEVLLKNL